jgi:hypothetical protein
LAGAGLSTSATAVGAGDLIKLTEATAAPATLAVKKKPRREALFVVSCMVLLQNHRAVFKEIFECMLTFTVTEKITT